MASSRHIVSLAFASSFVLAAPLTLVPSGSFAQAIGVSITAAPPALPVYAQPIIPGDGYLWQPGYWAWGAGGYYWVPGTWVLPPSVGLLWTPGYWGWGDGAFLWHAGYWGPHVGFYGGINYGFGYGGVGYAGGHWDNGRFSYNRAVNNFGGVHINNVYNEPVRNVSATRVSFNGGHGGTHAQPTAEERTAANEHHVDPTPLQAQHEHAAAGNHALFASANHGRPPVAATAQPATFTGHGVVGTRPQHQPQPAAVRPPQPGPAHPPVAHPASAPAQGQPPRGPQPAMAPHPAPHPAQPPAHAAPPPNHGGEQHEPEHP